MNIIAAVDKRWGIGIKGELLISIPEDMKFFKNTTTGNVVVMGRKTLESFPGKRPLKNRTNIVLTSDVKYKADGAETVHSIPELLNILKKYDSEKIYVIGGGKVYNQLLLYCDTAYITFINYEYEADTFLPSLDEDKEWEMTDESDEQTYFDIEYYFRKYKRINV
ncbi:MAG: dihydrofolate reductase [Lachnospiraceae bacterium]|nr:dihydrofolate reductase [Lachnospiraceae bacterium]MDE6253799.1 dihydrofolate reductase [Lachnospiraceae bacterium]